MKLSLKPILIAVAALVAVVLAVVAVIFFIPRDDTSFSFECFRLRAQVADFLRDVENERYDDAFSRIACRDAGGRPVESSAELQKIWTDRVSALRTGDNTYLNDHSSLKVRKENGEFTVTVTLSVLRQGYNDPFYSKGTTLTVVDEDGWKIVSVSEYEPALQTPLEKALSGYFADGRE